MAKTTASERILDLSAHQPLVRPRDVEALGIARESLLRLYRRGLLVRQARGVYALPQTPVTENHYRRNPSLCQGVQGGQRDAALPGVRGMTVEKVRNVAGSHRAKLLALARNRGEDFQFLLGRWVVERFLFRPAGAC